MKIEIAVVDDSHGRSTADLSLTENQREAVIAAAHARTVNFAGAVAAYVQSTLLPAIEAELG